jgi:hypothetical protein
MPEDRVAFAAPPDFYGFVGPKFRFLVGPVDGGVKIELFAENSAFTSDDVFPVPFVHVSSPQKSEMAVEDLVDALTAARGRPSWDPGNFGPGSK